MAGTKVAEKNEAHILCPVHFGIQKGANAPGLYLYDRYFLS
jgi:hypothetical protein